MWSHVHENMHHHCTDAHQHQRASKRMPPVGNVDINDLIYPLPYWPLDRPLLPRV